MRKALVFPVIIATGLCSLSLQAKVSQEQADKLGGPEFTPMGGERAGNADGTIPEWTGGLKSEQYPSNYQAGMFHPDPFPDDPILFTITRDNLDEHKSKLSEGAVAMFEKYSTYKMNVYQTRRTAVYPQFVYDAIKDNAVNSELYEDGYKPNSYSPKRTKITSPFPFPQSGLELIMNHKFRYIGGGKRQYTTQLVVAENADYVVSEILVERIAPYAEEGATYEALEIDNIYQYAFQYALGPARIAGGVIAVEGPIAPPAIKAWTYNPGQRRVRRAPQIAYDNPGTGSDGLRFTDQLSGFGGSVDRYTWDILGKEERYIPYNTYKIHSGDTKYDQIVQKGHINQDLMRYELHRVWVLDSNIRDGITHAYGKRTFTLDEDSWRIATVDCYDKRKELWRYQENWPVVYYEVPAIDQTGEVVYDLAAARYIVMDADNEATPPDYSWTERPEYFKPATMKGKAKR